MYRKDVNAQSPLRILEASMHGGLGPGNLGVVMARAGVGKTACLIQIALDDLLRSRKVLHVALGEPEFAHVRRWYRSLFDDLARTTALDSRAEVWESLCVHRMIDAHAAPTLSPAALDRQVTIYGRHLNFVPQAIIVTGFDFEDDDHAAVRETLEGYKATAARVGAELWMGARTHRELVGPHPTRVPPPCDAYLELVDVVLLLEPVAEHITIRLLKDHGDLEPHDTPLELRPDTLALMDTSGTLAPSSLPSVSHTLLSGAAAGAESLFGRCAEQWGVAEVNFTFAGRATDRGRGLVQLTDRQLLQGDVSSHYVDRALHRNFPDSAQFRKVLQSIWHQVNTAGEVFVVGQLQEDGTVRGGTGWAAELAKHLEKTLYVFDQERAGWYRWTGVAWESTEPPRIRTRRFTGTGTRSLNDAGRQAILGLFERSFGAQPGVAVGR